MQTAPCSAIVWPPAAPGRQLSSTGMAGCRNDICRDVANDCCAPGAEARGCAGSGYGVFPHGTSSYGQCVSRFGANAVYSCCPAQSCDSGCDRSCDAACNGSCDTCYVLFIFACNGEYPRNHPYCSSHPRYPTRHSRESGSCDSSCDGGCGTRGPRSNSRDLHSLRRCRFLTSLTFCRRVRRLV